MTPTTTCFGSDLAPLRRAAFHSALALLTVLLVLSADAGPSRPLRP